MEEFSQQLDEIESIPSKRIKKPSGHVAAGKKWDTSEKGRIWKEQTIRAKHELRDIIKQRTGLDTFANQRMTLKYAGFIRDGKKADAKRIIEQVIESAKLYNKKGTRKIQRETLQRNQRRRNKTEKRNIAQSSNTKLHSLNSAEGFKENPAEFPANANFQRVQPPRTSPPSPPTFQPIQYQPQNSADFLNDEIQLPDFLD
jgi:hypothetical protein